MFTLNNGNQFPLIGLGTYLVRGYDVIKRVIDESLTAGIRSFDTAAVYGNEEDIGKALTEILPKHNLKRSDIFITTKLAPTDQGHINAKRAALKSLKNLQLSYIDLYLIHWPGVEGVQANSQINSKLRKESWFDMVELYHQGLLKNIGVSNYTVDHLKELLQNSGGVLPVLNQVEFHPMYKQVELLEFCKENNILVQAYCSLGGSRGKHLLMEEPVVKEISKRINKTSAQVLLKWALQRGVAIIPKSTSRERIHSNFNLCFELSDSDMKALDSLEKNEKFSWEPSVVK